MTWLFPAIVSSLCGAIVLLFVYVYLYLTYRERFMGIWAASWGIYAFRYLATLAMIVWGRSPFLLFVSEASTIVSGYLLFLGTILFIRSRTHNIWLWLTGFALIWTALGIYYNFSFNLLTIPSYAVVAYFYIWTGGKILKSDLPSGIGKTVTAVTIILWGLHKADYPFLRHVDWFAPWGFIMGGVFSMVVAFGMILVYFEKTRRELINAKEHFRTLVNTIPDLIWLKDTDGIYLSCNTKFEGFFGAKEADIAGKTDYDFVEKELADFFRENDRKAMAAAKPFINEEWITFADGDHKALLETIKTPMMDIDGKLMGVLGVGHDITERKQMETTIKIKSEELESKNEELEAQNEEFEALNEELIKTNIDLLDSENSLNKSLREKETLLREVYHRTKNTMQVIRGIIVLQSSDYPSNLELQQLVRNTEDRIQAISLVHQMLYQSQDLSQISIKEYVQNLADLMLKSYSISDDRVILNIIVEDQKFLLDTVIPFGLIINELITNSFKYAFPEGRNGKIYIKLTREVSGKNLLIFSDNGVGVPDGFDFRNCKSLGIKLIYSLGEDQLLGKVIMENNKGISCSVEFPDSLYKARV